MMESSRFSVWRVPCIPYPYPYPYIYIYMADIINDNCWWSLLLVSHARSIDEPSHTHTLNDTVRPTGMRVLISPFNNSLLGTRPTVSAQSGCRNKYTSTWLNIVLSQPMSTRVDSEFLVLTIEKFNKQYSICSMKVHQLQRTFSTYRIPDRA